jgi:dihydrofolate synthase/folylpolyglutamate synthase
MPHSLPGWLAFIEGKHPHTIALGLERVKVVSRMLKQAKVCPVILVGGTNGKGSICAMLERILLCAGYRVAVYSSPHILRYNERVRVNGAAVSDSDLCRGFALVEAARAEVPLTYFEYGTLAAWEVFSESNPDVIILEVGLGGRLDAVNIYEPDCAVVSTVDLDHMDFLGKDREKIGYEKAGIYRSGKPAVCGDLMPPSTLLQHVESIGAELKLMGRDFGFVRQEQQWQFWSWVGKRSGLAHPALRGSIQMNNASIVLATLDAMREMLPVAMQDVRRGLMEVKLPGRFQVIPGKPAVVLDVAHNPQAATVLARSLGDMAFHPNTWAVFGIMADKDMPNVIRAIKSRVSRWLVCGLENPRAASAEMLEKLLIDEGITDPILKFPAASQAFTHALEAAGEDDRILVFGSFFTVADVMPALASKV